MTRPEPVPAPDAVPALPAERRSWRSDYVGFRFQLRRARKAAGLRQVDVAARIGFSVRHFARLESAEIDPQARTLFAWADAVGFRVSLTNMSGAVLGTGGGDRA